MLAWLDACVVRWMCFVVMCGEPTHSHSNEATQPPRVQQHATFLTGVRIASGLPCRWKNNDKFRHLEPEKMLRMTHAVAMFRKYDKDGDGSIDVAEYGQLCEDMGHKQNARQLEEGLAKLDSNKDGVINFDGMCVGVGVYGCMWVRPLVAVLVGWCLGIVGFLPSLVACVLTCRGCCFSPSLVVSC
jgi:EF-hand domain pair